MMSSYLCYNKNMKGQKVYNKTLLKFITAYALFTGIIAWVFLYFLFAHFQKTNQILVPPTEPTATPVVSVTQIPTPSAASTTPAQGKFCGGIAGIQCPAGYFCKLAGNYPDAGGTCVQKEAAVSPTCRPRPACLDSNPRCMIAETE